MPTHSSIALVALAALIGNAFAAAVPSASKPLDQDIAAMSLRPYVEEDWLRQAQAMELRAVGAPSTINDARGACDGIKNGKYGFHTAAESNPWWQVDLGSPVPISRIVIFNRLDYAPGLHNADAIRILGSSDGENWILLHDNRGIHFGGITGAKPLVAQFDQATARFVRLQIPSVKPIYFHLDEVEIFGPSEPGAEDRNLALHRPAGQSSISQWSTAKRLGSDRAMRYPTAEFIASGRSLARELTQQGVNCEIALRELDDAASSLRRRGEGGTDEQRRNLYLDTRSIGRRLAFSNPLLDFDQLLFVKRFTQETYPDVCLNHMPWVSRPGGDLCILSAAKGRALRDALAAPSSSAEPVANLRNILNSALGPGHVHGMDLSWDGTRVVFGYARAKTAEPPAGWLDRTQSYRLRRTEEPIHIFEVGVDGRNLRQLTSGEWSDLDPTYAPNGDIVFVSERCGTSLQCNEYDKDETSCNLYVMKSDGSGIRQMSINKDGDYLPHTLDDGTIAYTRWEYHERSWAFIQSIWTIRPDGTGADAVFKQHFVDPWALEDTRSIPGSTKLVSIAAGHHTLAVGPLVVVNPAAGINEPKGISIVTPGVQPPEGGMDGVPVKEGGVRDNGGFYSTPWALSEKHFLVSYSYSHEQTSPAGYALYLVDVFGNKELVYRDPSISCFTPIPLRQRPRPPILSSQIDLKQPDAICVVSDASFGSDGIAQVRYIRIAEPIGWPYDNERGGQRYGEDHRYGGPGAERKNLLSWTPIRILGDVPVESDGSAHFKVPADTAVCFQLLDENRMELRRMRSFISFQRGEVRACVGCHESAGISPPAERASLAASRAPSEPTPPPWGDRPISFLRDVQPVLDRNCVSCHSGLKPGGGLDFFAGLTSHDPDVAGYGHNRAYETMIERQLVSISQVRAQDASITPPGAFGSHKSKLIQALMDKTHSADVKLNAGDRLRLVTWIDANAPYHDTFVNKRDARAAYDLATDRQLQTQLAAVHQRRCAECHQAGEISRLHWIDFRQPEHSLFLIAPLAGRRTGSRHCSTRVYANADDPDYAALRELVSSAVEKAWQSPRRDLLSLIQSNDRTRQRAGDAAGEMDTRRVAAELPR